MAVIFRRFDANTDEYVDVGVVINNEYYGEDTNPVRGLDIKHEGVEDELTDIYTGRRFNAVKVPDDVVDIEEFRD